MSRPPPPMYVKVHRKVPPIGKRLPAPEEAAPEEVSTSLSEKQRRKLSKWSNEMSQKSLYQLAKSVGLEVRTRDSKESLIEKIKDALG